MTYPNSEGLIELFNRTHWVIKHQTDGLSHADSLLQPPFQANCLNWVVGHIVAGRNSVLTALGESPLWDEPELALYKRESEPITEDEQALPLDKLLSDLDQSQTQIIDALSEISPETLEQIADVANNRTVGQRIAFLHWHETYHTGQLELLRQLAGKNDKII